MYPSLKWVGLLFVTLPELDFLLPLSNLLCGRVFHQSKLELVKMEDMVLTICNCDLDFAKEIDAFEIVGVSPGQEGRCTTNPCLLTFSNSSPQSDHRGCRGVTRAPFHAYLLQEDQHLTTLVLGLHHPFAQPTG
jgi:hypothetical protein